MSLCVCLLLCTLMIFPLSQLVCHSTCGIFLTLLCENKLFTNGLHKAFDFMAAQPHTLPVSRISKSHSVKVQAREPSWITGEAKGYHATSSTMRQHVLSLPWEIVRVSKRLKGCCYCSTNTVMQLRLSSCHIMLWPNPLELGFSHNISLLCLERAQGEQTLHYVLSDPASYHGTSQTTYFRPLTITQGQPRV